MAAPVRSTRKNGMRPRARTRYVAAKRRVAASKISFWHALPQFKTINYKADKNQVRRRALLVVAILAIGASACAVWMSDRLVDRTYRAGFQHSPPRQYIAADGTPYGPNIDILQEAAARAHIRLQWVAAPEGPDKALRTGGIDL